VVEQRRAELEQLVKGLHRDLRVEVRVLMGTPFLEIVRAVLRDGHDLVIKDTEGRAAGTLFGSTALHLLRKCPVPVWIDRPGLPGLFIGKHGREPPEPGELRCPCRQARGLRQSGCRGRGLSVPAGGPRRRRGSRALPGYRGGIGPAGRRRD